MNVYEFTQALWRQKWLLLLGLLVLIPLSVALFLRTQPNYNATIQIAVMSADVESLAVDHSDSINFVSNAILYAALLRSEVVMPEIEEAEQVELIGLGVGTSSRDRFLTVTATAGTAEEAIAGALGSYTWLRQRLTEPLTLATVNPTIPASILDEDGKFTGVIEIAVSRAFAEAGLGLWLDISIAEEPVATVSLADAAFENSVNVVADLWPGAPMTLVLEDAFEEELDTIVKVLPDFPGPDTQFYNLVVRIDRGSLTTEGLLENRVAVSWEVLGDNATDAEEVGLLLVSPPIARQTGARRGPIGSAGVLFVGIFVLIAGAISIDTWSQAYREDARHVRPVDEQPTGSEPGNDEPEQHEAEEETADEDVERGPWQWQRQTAPSRSADA